MKAIAEDRGGWNTPMAFRAAASAALWSPDQLPTAADRIQTATAATSSLGGAWIVNARLGFDAAVAAIEGRREEALAGYVAALKTWTAMQLPLDHAATVGDAVVVLEPDALPPSELGAALSFLKRIGAKPLLARITAAGAEADPEKIESRA